MDSEHDSAVGAADAVGAAEWLLDSAGFAHAPVLAGFQADLDAREDMKDKTRSTYFERVRHFLKWVDAEGRYRDALTSADGRDRAVEDYIAAAVGRGVAGSTINVTRYALAIFYAWLGLDPPELDPADTGPIDPKTLDERELRSLLREAAAAGTRAYALIVLALDNNGPRETELEHLNVTDLDLSTFPGQISITDPGGRTRTETMQPETRIALVPWLSERASLLGAQADHTAALFITLSPPHSWLARRTLDDLVRSVGHAAGLSLSCRMLRATAEQRQLRNGVPAEIVAARLGQRKPDRARQRALLTGRPGRGRNRVALTNAEQLNLFGDAPDGATL